MKKTFGKILIFIASVMLLCGCGETWRLAHKEQTHEEYTLGSMKAYVYNYSPAQVDSMCVADKLPRDLNDWTTGTYTDYETGTIYIRKIYIKEFDSKKEMIYIITPTEYYYKVIKRYVEAK